MNFEKPGGVDTSTNPGYLPTQHAPVTVTHDVSPLYQEPVYVTNVNHGSPARKFSSSSSSSSDSSIKGFFGKKAPKKDPEDPLEEIDPYYIICKDTPLKIRHDFIIKVFSLVGISLAWAFGICLVVNFIPEAKEVFRNNWWIMLLSGVFMLVISIIMVCSRKIATRVPYNYIFLALYSTCSGCLIAGAGAFTDTMKVLVPCVAAVLFVCCLCLLLGFQTKIDFTARYCMVAMGVGFMGLLMFNMIAFFCFYNSTVQMITGSLGVIIFSFALVIDIQMIVGHKHRVRFSIDDYANAALQLHTDVINIFLYMLRFMGAAS